MAIKDDIINYVKAVISRHDSLLNDKFVTKGELSQVIAGGTSSAVDGISFSNGKLCITAGGVSHYFSPDSN